MYQVASIVSHNRNRAIIANELNVAFNNNVATFNQYVIGLYGPIIQITCEHINNIIEIKNFINRVSQMVGAYDNEVNRTIITINPNQSEYEYDSTDEECDTESEYEEEEEEEEEEGEEEEDYDW